MSENPHDIMRKLDEDMADEYITIQETIFQDGALSKKTKTLMALACDASKGIVQGIQALVGVALEVGATWDEIKESLQVAHYIGYAGPYWATIFGIKDHIEKKV